MTSRVQIPVLVSLVVLCLGQPCLAQAEKIKTRALAADEVTVVERAIQVVKDKVAFLREEAKALVDKAKKLEDEGKADEAAAARLQAENHRGIAKQMEDSEKAFEGVLGKGGVATGKLPPDAGGATRGPGNELDALGNVKAGDTGNRVLLSEDILTAAKQGDCEADFLLLVRLILHEGAHLTQTLPDLPDPDNIGPSIDTEDKAKDLVNKKSTAIFNEKLAYGLEELMMQQMITVMRQIRRGDPVDSWGQRWKDCPNIEALVTFLQGELGRVGGIGDKLAKLASIIDDERGKKTPESEIAKTVDIDESFGELVAPGANVMIGFDDDSSSIKVASFDGKATFVDTGIAHPQDVAMIRDHSGAFKLVVCGFSNATGARGVVLIFDLPEAGVPPPGTEPSPIPKPIFMKAEALSCKTLCTSNPFLLAPTSIMVAPDGRVFVWDVESVALYLLPDDDGDGTPDRIDLRSRVRVPRGFHVEHLTTVRWFGDGPVLDWRIGQPVDQGDLPIFLFRNEGADGVFRSVLPRRWTQLLRHSK